MAVGKGIPRKKPTGNTITMLIIARIVKLYANDLLKITGKTVNNNIPNKINARLANSIIFIKESLNIFLLK
jgi:hypothetical protein